MKYSFTLENLNCANCAGKIENKIASIDGYENVALSFATKRLLLESNADVTVNDIQQICDSIEDGVKVTDSSAKNTNNSNKSFELISLIISAVLGVTAFIFEFIPLFGNTFGKIIIFVLSICATLLAGYKTFIEGAKSLLKLRINETTLMSIAVIAAFCIGEFAEASMVTILFAFGELIEDKAVDASRHDIEKLANIRPDNATILSDGKEIVVPAESVKTGSMVIVKPHERIPLDGIIKKGETTLDASALTGESLPLDGNVGTEVLSGMINGNSLIEIQTTKGFGDSTAARILKLVEDAAATKGQSEKFISRFAAVYTPIVIVISVLIAFLPPLFGLGDLSVWIYRALVCLVASCPCAIVISVPLAFYSGIGAASKVGVLIKGGKYLEALAQADSFVFDKTGTLTTGELSVNKVYAYGKYSENEILALAAACEKYSVHPIAKAIKENAQNLAIPELENYSEKAGHGACAEYNGKSLLCGGTKILSDSQKKSAEKSASVFVVLDGEIIGAVSVSDSIRDEATEVISSLKKDGVKKAVMLTGDRCENAEPTAKALGLTEFSAELMPADKLEKLNNIKKDSKAVCFVGDGINDAPVLTASDCGFAMGFGSEAAIEAADAVLASGNLKQLPKARRIAKKVVATVKTNITFALAVKAAVIILAILGYAPIWLSVIADTGVSVLCILYAARLLKV